MVNKTTSIVSESGKNFRIFKSLTCKDFGIYVASCKSCNSQYVGQTVTSFSTRWAQHRQNWKMSINNVDDRAALRMHYKNHHKAMKDLDLPDAFVVAFVDRPANPGGLDILEASWVSRLCATININKTPLPKYR